MHRVRHHRTHMQPQRVREEVINSNEFLMNELLADTSVCFRAAAVSRLMGNLVLTNKKAQFVLTHKLLLQQYQHTVSSEIKDTNINNNC